uniref:Uncharacterized protein n=1 Tax=Panagrolaimus sp. PS1159 TaxID=55785 RepID=A0AC35GA97_9BILA
MLRLSVKRFILIIFIFGILICWICYFCNERQNFVSVEKVYTELTDIPESNTECKFYANPFDPRIADYIKPPHPPASCHPLQSQGTSLINGILTLLHPTSQCQYRYFQHNSGIDDFSIKYDEWIPFNSSKIKMEKDFIDISCQNKLGLEYYRYQWASIVPKNVSIENGKPFQDENEEHLNVIMLGFDGISRSNFIRQLPKSKTFMDKLGFVTMEKHTKIADNTFPNWMGILLGEHTYDYEFPATVDNREHIDYDNWTNLLWRRFSRNGYATMLSEDEPKVAAFNYNKRMNGFISRPPTDHYIRPWYLALDEHYLRSRSSKFCYDSFSIHKLQFQYSKSFLQEYKGKRKFLWQWLTEVSHDYLNTVGVVDEDFVQFLTEIQPNFNNSIVIVFSDHGNRYDSIRETVIGRLESRLPFLSIKLPEWFSKKYPKMEENLKANSKVLTSHFDLHAMLVQILQGNFSSPPPKLPRGISLFSSIPTNRTCFSAEIPSQFCPCFKEYEIPLTNDTTFADLILEKIHNYFAEKNVLNKCAKMELDSIKSISLSLPPSKLSLDELQPSLKGDLYHYRIQFQVKPPSNAIFEGIVVKNKFSGEMKVLNDIERNNRYGNTSHCVDNELLKKLCYCI